MKSARVLSVVVALALLLVSGLGTTQAQGPLPQGTQGLVLLGGTPQAITRSGFTYQGQLYYNGSILPDDYCEMDFTLWDAETGGNLRDGPIAVPSIPVRGGLFTVYVDFGDSTSDTFDGQQLFLGIDVLCAPTGYVTLSRQELTAAPYALSLRPGAKVYGNVDTGLSVAATGTGVFGQGGTYGMFGSSLAASGYSVGVRGDNTSTDGWGVHGFSSATSGTTYGVGGVVSSPDGYGVYGGAPNYGVLGSAGATSGAAYGVRGEAFSTGGRGVYGYAPATTGTTYGVGGEVDSPAGRAIYGVNNASTGEAWGVYGTSHSIGGRGVYGFAVATSGTTYGVYGQARSADGYGVLGWNNATTGDAYGVYGWSQSPDGRGVYGYADTITGTNSGVYGESNSTQGRGVTGWSATTTGSTIGVYGHSSSPDGRAVYGGNSAGSGTAYGVRGVTYSTAGQAVSGAATATTGTTYGVYGSADSTGGSGVYGLSPDNECDWGMGGYCGGVVGQSTSGTGILGVSGSGTALAGVTSGGTGLYLMSVGGSPDFIAASNYFPYDRKFRVDNAGEVYADGSFHPGGADFAEMLPAVADLEPGDVLVIGPDGQLARSTQAYQDTVVGVYSTKPGVVGGAEDGSDLTGKAPLAVVGVVPVKVSAENGAIQPGDMLVASGTPGHAMRAGANLAVGTVIGKALAGLDQGTGVILMLVVLQ